MMYGHVFQRDTTEVKGSERASLSGLHNKSGHTGSKKSIPSIFTSDLIGGGEGCLSNRKPMVIDGDQ